MKSKYKFNSLVNYLFNQYHSSFSLHLHEILIQNTISKCPILSHFLQVEERQTYSFFHKSYFCNLDATLTEKLAQPYSKESEDHQLQLTNVSHLLNPKQCLSLLLRKEPECPVNNIQIGEINIQNNTNCLETRLQLPQCQKKMGRSNSEERLLPQLSLGHFSVFRRGQPPSLAPSSQAASHSFFPDNGKSGAREGRSSFPIFYTDMTLKEFQGFITETIKSLEAKLPQIPLFTPTPQHMPVQCIIAINSTINSILSCSLVYLQDMTPGQQLPLKKPIGL